MNNVLTYQLTVGALCILVLSACSVDTAEGSTADWSFDAAPTFLFPSAVHNENAFFGAGDGTFRCMSVNDGVETWSAHLQAGLFSKPTVVDDTVYVTTVDGTFREPKTYKNITIHALSLSDGTVRWTAETGRDGFPGDAIVGSGTVTTTAGPLLIAFDAKTGEKQWMYKHKTGSLMGADIDDGTLVVTGTEGRAVGIAVDSGDVLWNVELGGRSYFRPSITNGQALVGTMKGNVLSLDTKTGKETWNVRVTGGMESSGIVIDGTFYFGTRSAVLYALDTKSGDVLWSEKEKRPSKKTTVFSNFAVNDESVVYGTWDKRIVSVNPKTGERQWEVKTDAVLPNIAATDTTLLYSGFGKSSLTALAQN